MKLQVAGDDGQLVLMQVDGPITQKGLSPAGDLLVDLLGPGAYTRKVLVDLTRSPMVDSSGIGWMIKANKQFNAHGGLLVVHSYSPMVSNTMKLLKMDKVLHLCPTHREAEALARGGVQ